MNDCRGVTEPVPGEPRPNLIVLEDDQVTRTMVARYFQNEGFDVREAASAAECRTLLKARDADLIFIDIKLPDANGISFAQDIRAKSPVGIIFVTQLDSELDRVVGLEVAGDDYVTKPINLRELMARSRALLRRRKLDREQVNRRNVITFDSYILDLTRRELSRSGRQVPLTRGEFDLLAALVEAEGRPLYRDYLAEVISSRPDDSNMRTVDSLVSRLRRKLAHSEEGSKLIITVTGIGYRFGAKIAS